MTPKNIQQLLKQTQSLMFGINYEVTLGVEIFDNCFSLQDINSAIKTTFPNSNPEQVNPIMVAVEDCWQDIKDKFDYRGDNMGVSLQLNEKQEKELKVKQTEIINFIAQYMDDNTKVYSYPFLEGIPGYPVFWEYTFASLNTNGTCVFFHGSSSD